MTDNSHSWIQAEGEMVDRIRQNDWSKTPLGPIENWPISLRNHLNHILDSPFPAVICWGKDLITLYNDAYQPLLGDKSDSLGKPFRDIWPEALDAIDPLINKALQGEPSYVNNFKFTLERYGKPEQAWFDFSFSPLRDERGAIVGILNTGQEVTEERKVQEELCESEQKYRTLFESIDEGLCIIKVIFDENDKAVDYQFLETNPAFEDQTGIENAQGRYMRDIAPNHEEHWFETYGKVAKTQQPVRFENAAKALGYYYDGYAFPVDEPESNQVGILFNNISDRKQAEKKLHDSEKRLRLATRAADMHLCDVDLVENRFDWPGDVPHQVDFPMPQTLEEARSLVHPEDEHKVLEILRGIAKQDGSFEIEYRIKEPSTGETLWIYSAGTALEKKDGIYTRIISVSKNITERKQAELRDQFLSGLTKSLQQISDPVQIMETMTQMLADHLKVDRCTYAEIAEDENHFQVRGSFQHVDVPSMESSGAMTDFGEEAVRLMRQNEPFVVDDVAQDERITEADEEAYRKNKIQSLVCIPLHKDDRFKVKLAVHCLQPRTWFPREIKLLQTVAQRCWEAIERARLSRELHEMNESLEERIEERTKALKVYQNQLRALARELNKAEERERHRLAEELHSNLGQMLAVGKIQLNSLKNSKLPDEAAKNLEQSAGLIDEALAYTRELMANLSPPPSHNNGNLTELIRWVAEKMEQHGLTTTVEEKGAPKPLDEEVQTTLRRCVNELLFNIIKHARVDTARVEIIYDNGVLQVAVEDEGRGFDADQEFAPDGDGGFGLFNIKERINWLGGRLEFDSEAGKGTRAIITIPFSDKPEARSVEQDEREPPALAVKSSDQGELWKQITVIVVDDHKMMREGLRELIEGESNMKVIADASTGEEAIDIACKMIPDIIVMDVDLPDMTGMKATEKIKEEQPDICIIGLSLHDREEVGRDMKNAGAAAFLSKTEAFESLCGTIKEEVKLSSE